MIQASKHSETHIPRFFPGIDLIFNSIATVQNYIQIFEFLNDFKRVIINNDFNWS